MTANHPHAVASRAHVFDLTARRATHVFRDSDVFVKVSPKWWSRNVGGALVIPVEHHENLYGLPDRLAVPLVAAVRDTAVAMRRAYQCDGISIRQHNEPAGGQDVWHLHIHVLPRYENDLLYERNADWFWAEEDQVIDLGQRLKNAWPGEQRPSPRPSPLPERSGRGSGPQR